MSFARRCGSALKARAAFRAHRVCHGLLVTLIVGLSVTMSTTADAAVPRPHWSVLAMSTPTYFKPGDEGDFYEVIAMNDGSAPTDGSNIVVSETLPAGVTPTQAYGAVVTGLHGLFGAPTACPASTRCETTAVVPVGEIIRMKIIVSVGLEVAGVLRSDIAVSGGGAEPLTASESVTVSASEVPFGASLTTDIIGEAPYDEHAASHPIAFTSSLAFNAGFVNTTVKCDLVHVHTPGCAVLNSNVKDLDVTLPRGMVGDPTAVPRCSQTMFQTYGNANCPADTQVGVLHVGFYGSTTAMQYAPLYNVEPPPGQPAELGFSIGGQFHIPMYFHVRSDGDYALVAQLSNISAGDPVRFAMLSVWGTPAAAFHETQRQGEECSNEGCSSQVEKRPFLTLPGSCTGSELAISVSGDSWQEPVTSSSLPVLTTASLPALRGCDVLAFSPSLVVESDTLQAGAPAGYTVKLDVPQSEDPQGLATPNVRDVQLTLPEGTVVSPAAANGLAACTEQQFELRSGLAGHCPSQAKLGQVSIVTPLLLSPLHGSVFLGKPECGPCTPADAQAGRLTPLLLEVTGPGVVIKLAGHTSIDQTTGRITTEFAENPQLPFSIVEVTLQGGDNAPLVNPTSCGDAVAIAKLTPWSTLMPSEAVAPPMPISGCSAPSFGPSLRAGTSTAQAGAFSSFSVTLARPEGQQVLGSVAITTPTGLLGMLSKVALCGEAQANAGSCPSASEIGTASTTVGPGSRPLAITGGRVFLTGPYGGAPFGLSIVMPTEAGPFQLAGNTGGATEVVRASIAVDPHTSAVTITSRLIPTELEGIPLEIRDIDVIVDRPGFMFNPTNCDALAITGLATSANGMAAAMSAPFQAVNCAMLRFSPKFTVTTQAKTSKARGASLHVTVTSGHGQANIGKVKVDLPKQLPSRLTTLQKACTADVFDANPASCPSASVVGTGKATTPVLSGPLIGPAYLVSHGGAAFPDLEIVLQGQGITLILDGATHIKHGITSSTFSSIPDAPVERFDLVLPTGSHSVLAANLPSTAHGSMCGQKLIMPTAITGQNGAVVEKKTVVSIAGCPRARAARTSSAAR